MHIQELSLDTRHLADQKDFYHSALGLPLVAETTASFALQTGATRLRFQEAQHDVLYHVTFMYPRNTFTEAKSWLSEVGLPVEDVLAQVSLLEKKLAIEPYRGLVSEEFAFMGDIYGQLVVVKIGRPWQPAETLLAAVSPMQLTMSGKPEQQLQLSPFP